MAVVPVGSHGRATLGRVQAVSEPATSSGDQMGTESLWSLGMFGWWRGEDRAGVQEPQ